MDWIPIDLSNPLILLRVYLAAAWGGTAIYALWIMRSLPRKSASRLLAGYSVFASLAGGASYFLGAATVFHSAQGFLWVGGLLTFTPIAMLLWLFAAKRREP